MIRLWLNNQQCSAGCLVGDRKNTFNGVSDEGETPELNADWKETRADVEKTDPDKKSAVCFQSGVVFKCHDLF